jgi:hypothetical protein
MLWSFGMYSVALFKFAVLRKNWQPRSGAQQGCQIFLGTTYQNGDYHNYHKIVPNGNKIWQQNRQNCQKNTNIFLYIQDLPKFTQIAIWVLNI